MAKSAKYRSFRLEFWEDDYILNCDKDETLIYINIFTNPRSSNCGIFYLPKKLIEFHTKCDRETIDRAFQKFIRDGKIVYSEVTKEVCICNWIKNNFKLSDANELNDKKEDNQIKGFLNALEEVEDKGLIPYLRDIDKLVKGYKYPLQATCNSIDKDLQGDNNTLTSSLQAPYKPLDNPLKDPCEGVRIDERHKTLSRSLTSVRDGVQNCTHSHASEEKSQEKDFSETELSQEEKPPEKKSKKKKKEEFVAPTVEEAQAYAEQIGYTTFNAWKFVSYYESQEWKKNNGLKISNWKQAIINWREREKDTNSRASPSSTPQKDDWKKTNPHFNQGSAVEAGKGIMRIDLSTYYDTDEETQ